MDDTKMKCAVTFAIGAALGALVGYKITKTKYEQIAQEQIDSVKEVFAKRQESVTAVTMDCDGFRIVPRKENDTSDIQEKAKQAKEKPDINAYTSKLQKEGYIDYSAISAKKPTPKTEQVDDPGENNDVETGTDDEQKPYVISPDEFGENEDYDRIGLNYFADKVLAHDDDTLFEDVDEIIGLESLTHFGEYEDDSVFVRNDRLKIDYEILLDSRNYSDVIKRKPHHVEE
jgi:hypothetical protein